MIAPRQPAEHKPNRPWTVADLLLWTEQYFRKLSLLTPRLDAEVLLAKALECTRLELYTGYHKVVVPEERSRFRTFVERRTRGEPVAYITGAREFHSLKFEVSPAVFIPRPETEHLVDALVEHLAKRTEAGGNFQEEVKQDEKALVLDLGTGSGNIAVAVAREIRAARLFAVDISPEALNVARRNAETHGVSGQIDFLEGNLYSPLRSRVPKPLFDAIVSNPPYIPPREREALPVDVRDFEPAAALFDRTEGSDGDGLGFHRAILREAPDFLLPRGILALEVGAGQAREVQELFQRAGFSSIRVLPDFGGIPRVVIGELDPTGPA